MTLQPDDPGRRPPSPEGAALVRPGETTEPVWVLPAIILGLVALTGSLMLWALVGVAALVLWLMSVPPTAPPEGGRDSFGYPLGGPFGSGGIVP